MIAEITLTWVVYPNALLRVAISYTTALKAKMSVRASTSVPSNCSGAMYCNVPTIAPSAVNGSFAVRSSESDTFAGVASCFSFAKPKSSSFVPDLVSMTLPGLRSRCVTPFLCALSSASEIWWCLNLVEYWPDDVL